MNGKIKSWLSGRGFGFIESDESGEDIFIHSSDVHGAYDLKEGQKVKFDVQNTSKGPKAINVRLIE